MKSTTNTEVPDDKEHIFDDDLMNVHEAFGEVFEDAGGVRAQKSCALAQSRGRVLPDPAVQSGEFSSGDETADRTQTLKNNKQTLHNHQQP